MPAHTAYGYDLELCLGIGRQDQAGRWDVDRWDLIVWDQPDTELGDWVDVTCSVPGGAQFNAGSNESNGVVVQWEAATCSFDLLGAQWDPWGGPYAGVLGPQTWVRWRWRVTGDADWEPLFYGAVQDGGYQWDPRTSTASLACTDRTADLAGYNGQAQAFTGAGELAAARIGRILDMARWPAADRDIGPGGVALVATDLSGTALEQVQAVADTDVALMWVRRDGRFAYRPQGRANPATPSGRLVVCVTDPDDVQVIDISRADFTPVTNVAAVRGGTVPAAGADSEDYVPPYVTVTDERSIARYRARQTTSDLLHDTAARPDWSGVVARLIVMSQSWPSMAPHEVVLGLASQDARVPLVLFTLEPDTAFEVVDPGGKTWTCEVSGWDITLSYASCGGILYLNDVTSMTGGLWDDAGWDIDRWGLGQVS